MIIVCSLILIWCFLESTFWWVAPDVSISIAYAYFPKRWKLFLGLALIGAILGSVTTYLWASYSPYGWLHYVSGMPFHSEKNIQYVQTAVLTDPFSIIKAAWGGVPYKLFLGLGAMQHVPFTKLILLGLPARFIRFSFTLFITTLIRKFTQPWSINHPGQLSALLLFIWAVMIALFDTVINKLFL